MLARNLLTHEKFARKVVLSNQTLVEARTITTLSQLVEAAEEPHRTVRTLVIANDVEFTIIGKTWVFDDAASARVLELVKAHKEKAIALGLKPQSNRRKPRSKRKAESVA